MSSFPSERVCVSMCSLRVLGLRSSSRSPLSDGDAVIDLDLSLFDLRGRPRTNSRICSISMTALPKISVPLPLRLPL